MITNAPSYGIDHPKFVFFGTPRFAVITLEELKNAGFLPELIITAPDKPKGRKLLMTPSEVHVWGEAHNIPVRTPLSLNDDALIDELQQLDTPLFIVSAYGKLIPKTILDIPKYGVLNVHPSLLPKFRGASPIESAILSGDTETGVTIMEVDEEMDHGAIVVQKKCATTEWPPKGSELTEILAREGGVLLASVVGTWIEGRHATPQDDNKATYTKKIAKEDGLIDLSEDPRINLKKIRAYDEWPGGYFFVERNGKQTRVRIVDAILENGNLTITRVIPEGKKEMSYADFLRGLR